MLCDWFWRVAPLQNQSGAINENQLPLGYTHFPLFSAYMCYLRFLHVVVISSDKF